VRYEPSFPYKDIYIFPASFFSGRGTQTFVVHRARAVFMGEMDHRWQEDRRQREANAWRAALKTQAATRDLNGDVLAILGRLLPAVLRDVAESCHWQSHQFSEVEKNHEITRWCNFSLAVGNGITIEMAMYANLNQRRLAK
jgi:hypothetical protein